MSVPRVIFVNRVYRPSTAATAQLLTDLAEGLALRLRDWDLHVIAAGTGPEQCNGVSIHRTGGEESHAGLLSQARNYAQFLLRARQQTALLARPGDVVVVMTDPPMLGAAVTGIAKECGAGVVHWIQDIYPEIVSAHAGAIVGLPLLPLRWKRDDSWRAARRCVALGEDMAKVVTARGVSEDKLVIAPNWAPRELDAPAPEAAVAARRIAWGCTDKFIVAYSGNLGRVHEFAAVLGAADELRGREDIVFVFIGRGPRFDEVHAAAQARGLANIRFLPPETRENLAAALAAPDAHLVTLKPTFARLVYPSKLAGVLAAGRPVLFVGPPDGEIARLLAREQCGAAFAPSDGVGLASTVRQWQADAARRTQLGRAARGAYERHFTFGSVLAHWEDILRRAATS